MLEQIGAVVSLNSIVWHRGATTKTIAGWYPKNVFPKVTRRSLSEALKGAHTTPRNSVRGM